MNKFAFLLLISLTFVSCSENIKDNRPALQGVIDGDLYKSINAQATRGVNGDLTISGLTTNEDLTLRLDSAAEGTYNLGGNSNNSATYTTANDFIYTTNPEGNGQVVIRQLDEVNQNVYGSFEFDAVVEGLDTIKVRNGIFFEVPFTQEVEIEIPDPVVPMGPCNAGQFVASIDDDHDLLQGSNLCVMAVIFQDQIVVTATDPDEEIQVRVPLAVGVGQNPLPADGFSATYTDLTTMVTEEAISGNFIVLSHNIDANLIKITFSFNTPNHVIDGANFNVTYQ